MDYRNKYNKYKSKYLNLKKRIIGAAALVDEENIKKEIISFTSKAWYGALDSYIDGDNLGEIEDDVLNEIEIKTHLKKLLTTRLNISDNFNQKKNEISKNNFVVNIILEEIEYINKMIDDLSKYYLESEFTVFSDLDKEYKLRFIKIIVSNIRLINLYKLVITLARDEENDKVYDLYENMSLYTLIYNNYLDRLNTDYFDKIEIEVTLIHYGMLLSKFDGIDDLIWEPRLNNSNDIHEYVYFYYIFSKKKDFDEEDIDEFKDIMFEKRRKLFDAVTFTLPAQIKNIEVILSNFKEIFKDNQVLEKKQELEYILSYILDNLHKFMSNVKLLKAQIIIFFMKVFHVYKILNEMLDGRISTLGSVVDQTELIEYINEIQIYELFSSIKSLPIDKLNKMLEESIFLKQIKSLEQQPQKNKKRAMLSKKLEDDKREKDYLEEKERHVSFGIGDKVILKEYPLGEEFIIIKSNITGKKFILKRLSDGMRIRDEIESYLIKLVRTAKQLEEDIKKQREEEEKRERIERELLEDEEKQPKKKTKKKKKPKTDKKQAEKEAKEKAEQEKAEQEKAERERQRQRQKAIKEEAEQKKREKAEQKVREEAEQKELKVAKQAQKKDEQNNKKREEVVKYLKELYEKENKKNNKVNELINPLLISLKEKYSELKPGRTIEFLQYGSRGEKNTAISGSDLEYYILFDKSKEDFLKKIESFYNNNKFKKYISDKLHNNIEDMEEYHTAHKTICEKTINSDNILALNNMLKNMKYTDMEMELEGEFRPPNPEKPCHCISSFTIKNINHLNENIDNFIKEIGYKIEFSLETPSTEVIGHDRIVKMFSEKYPLFKYLILFIKKDLMRNVGLSGTSIEIILLSFLDTNEKYINIDITDDNNIIIEIIQKLLKYLENFEEHNIIRLKNYYNYMGEIVTLQKKSEKDLGTEDLLIYYNQQIKKFETYIERDAKSLIIHPISLKIIWGGYPNMAKGPRETVYENLKINCREFKNVFAAVRR